MGKCYLSVMPKYFNDLHTYTHIHTYTHTYIHTHYIHTYTHTYTHTHIHTVVSRKYAPPFATLASVQNAGGAYTRDATISLAIMPPSGTDKE